MTDEPAALAAGVAPGVKVRKLEWVWNSFDGFWYGNAQVPPHYRVTGSKWCIAGRENRQFLCDGPDAAKAAAQADYEARILSAMEPAPSALVAEPVAWRSDLDDAPRDGTMVRLLVRPVEGGGWTPFSDSWEPYETIGFNNLGNTGEDVWQFAGWDWSHDCFTDGHGEIVGWLPLYAPPARQDGALREALDLDAAVSAAACTWCGEKDRETFQSDVDYFKCNWRALGGLTAYVDREIGKRVRAALAESAAPARDTALPMDRDTLGRMVREAWVRWAMTQPSPKASWLAPYDELAEADKEADRQIGEAIAKWTITRHNARFSPAAPAAPNWSGWRSIEKKLLRLRDKLIEISDHIEHEGDRAYFGSTNHADDLREIFLWLDGFKWDRAMSESDEYDLLSSVERLLARAEAAEAEAARLREQIEHMEIARAASAIVDDVHRASYAAQEENARLREAATRVVWFDWTENDPDAVAAIGSLRAALGAGQ